MDPVHTVFTASSGSDFISRSVRCSAPNTYDYKGRDAVFGLFAKLGELSGGTLQIHDDDFLGSDERSVSLFRFTATRGDKTLDTDLCEVVRWRDGQVVEEWVFAFDQSAYDEFWS